METKEMGRDNWLTPVKHAVFGRQNERIEFLIDSYVKLSPEGRTAVVVGSIAGGALLLVAIVGMYLAALSSLQGRLDNAFEAVNSLKEARYSYTGTRQKFAQLEQKIEDANRNLALISFLESKAREHNVTASGFPAQPAVTELPANNPLAEKYQSARVRFNVSNVSLKRIVDMVTAIEAAPHMLKVTSLTIDGGYANKLFFNATLEVEGTVAKR